MKKINKKGFTLVELLVAITILGIIMVIALPQLSNIQNNNKTTKYRKYAESMMTSAKLYTDSYTEDMFGNNKSGCVDIPYEDMKDKDLLKDIKVDGSTCKSPKSYIRVRKANDHYFYEVSISCKDKEGNVVYEELLPENACNGIGPDEKSPEIKITPDQLDWTKGTNKKLTIKIWDEYGMLENTKIKLTWTKDGAVYGTSTTHNFKNKRYDASNESNTLSYDIEVPQGETGIFKLTVTPIDVRDSLGNYQTINKISGEYKLDNTPPNPPTVSMYKWKDNSTEPTSTSLFGLSLYENEKWSNKNIYIYPLGSTDTHSGGVYYKYKTKSTVVQAEYKNITTEGETIISWRACDKVGNCSSYSDEKIVKIDKTPPTCTVTGGNSTWINASSTTTSRTVTATCADEVSGCATSPLSYTYSSDISTTTAGALGNNAGGTVYDNAGNSVSCAANQTVKIDKTAPSTPTVSLYKWANNSTKPTSSSGLSAYSNNTWSNKKIYTVASGSTDAMSDFIEYQYTTTGTTTNNTNEAASTRNVEADGTSYIKYRACDNAGNCSGYSTNYTLNIDKTNPTCTNSGDSTRWTKNNRTIYWGCSDSHSGCNSSYSGSSETYSTTTKIASIRAYTIKDNAGNETTCPARTADVYVDKTPPTAPTVALVKGDWGELSNNTWQPYAFHTSGSTNSSSPYPSSSDSHSGISKYQISPNNSTWYDWNYWDTTTYSNELYRNYGDGTTYRYVRAVDRAGNVSPVTTKTIKQDTTAPVCGNVTGASTSWTTSNRTISVACSDAASGCTAASYSNTWSSGKTQTSTIRIYDNAGNYTDCGVNVYVDKTTPQVTVSGNMNNWVTYDNKGCDWYGRAKWNETVCKNASGYCDNTAGKVTTSISGNVVTFNWYVANGAESYIEEGHWVKFIIKNSSGTEIYSTYLKEEYNPNKWDKGGNFSGTLSYTFNDEGTYHVYMDGNTLNSPKYDWTMGTITVTKG